ncbi:gliding motility-associated C-terminal domain-containing protein [Flavobacterium bizetiae]|uniref:Ig-like domain-containing protein n=1 Tax=Flavobacterium bizetiae TaxID=2704140 RepID=UPI0021E9774A|nr:gliding motility-associated C-terminal domain-containing protein [Flavobacterium bizetiae]UTN02427.1 gliding motility-associated C-terminal domain-containing protein [Flavobacterium bizetiae]
MKKTFTFYDLIVQRRLLAVWLLLFLLLMSNKNFAQTFCRPTGSSTSIGGVCLGTTGVTNATLAYDSSLSTYATITNSLGVGCFAEETVTFNQTAKAGDQIVLYYGNGSAVISAGVLANSTIQPFLSNVSAGSAVPLSGLVNLQLLDNGENINVVKYTLTSDANQIKIQTGGLVSLLINLRIYDVRLQFAKPTIANGETQSVCFGQSVALSATAAAGTTVAWYDSPTATTPLSNVGTYTTPALTASTTYYVSTSRNGVCESDQRLPVTINVVQPIAPVISATGTTICSAGATQATTLSVINPVLGTTYSWYNVATGGVALTTGTTYTPTVPTGISTYYVEASIGTCKSTRTQVNVTSTPVPALATILTQGVSILAGQNATLSASTAEPGVGLDWYDTPTGGTKLLANSTTFTTPILTATKIYYVESVNLTGGCVSTTRVPVTVTVQPAALGGCREASSQVTTQVGICLLCSSTNLNNSVDGNPATAASLTIPIGVVASLQQTLQFTNPGKAGDIVDVELALPGGIADLSLLGAVSLATYNGATYNNDRIAITNPLISLQLLSGNRFRASVVAGANFDRVEIRLGAVANLLTTVDIYQATYRYKAPVISGNTTICSGQTATLNANLALGETIRWYDALTGGNLLNSTASFTTLPLTANTTYYVELTRNGCVNGERNPVTVTVNNPVAPTAISTVPTNLCSGETTTITIQSPVAGTTYNWYDAATGGTLVFTGTSFVTPSLTVPTTYHIEAVIGTCLSARTPVNVNVNPRPAPPVPVSSNVIIQSGQNVQLSVVSDPGVSYLWYDAPTGGTLLQGSGSNTYTPNPVLTANKTFYVEAVNGLSDCKSISRAAINVMVTNTVSTCLQPSTQAITVDPGLLCVLCNGINGPNAVDANPNNFASLTITAGVLNSYIQQELKFLTPGQAGDIIDVELELPGGLADLSLLGSVSIGTSNGGVENLLRLAVNNSLLNLQVLSGNRFKVSFKTNAAFDQVDIRLGALVGLLTTLNVYGASYRFPNATITGATAPICAGQTATLAASSTGTETFTWYDAPTGGNIVAVSPTLPLTATTIYYLEATRGGTCINSVRQPVTVNVLSIPTAADITIASPLTASCAGGIVLAPTSALAGATFKYYTDQNKTQEITTGTTAGVTYVKDPTTGALTISGLTALNAPYTYYLSVSNGGICENVNETLKEVVVNYPAGAALTVANPYSACGKANLKDAITNLDTSGDTTYTFFDASNNIITDAVAANITATGNYFIQAQKVGVACPSVKLPVVVNVNPLPTLTGVTNSIAVTKGSSVNLTATSNGTIAWYDQQGNLVPSSNLVLNTVGIFTYTVIATLGNCTTSQIVTISVIDPATCDTLLERVYANTELAGSIITGGVTNRPLAVDNDPSTYSTITTGLGLLGIGTTWQNLQWPTTITKGTPVTVKLGLQNSLLAVGGSISVIGTKRDGSNNPIDIGTLQSVSGSLLTLLPGQNSFEYTFVPSNNSGVQDYDGIRVQLGSVLSLAQNINVYDAYYKKQVTQIACGQGDIEDIFSGAKELAGLGVLTATVGVTNPWNVADRDVATYATMFTGVGVLANAELAATFRTPSMVGDSLRITISKPGTLLSLGVLSGLNIQLYSGNIPVGPSIQGDNGSLLTLKLLAGDTMAMTIVAPQTQPYDKVVITLGGAANVLDQLRVHTIDRVTNTKVIGGDPDNKITVCPGATITLTVPTKSCADYAWYDSPTGGNLLTGGQSYTLPATLAAGTYKYYIQPIRYGCAALERGEVTVVVRATTPAAAIANVTINGNNNTIVCTETGTVTLDAILNGTPVLTNPVYSWYSFNGTTSQLIAGETTPKLIINGLVPGTYTYYVGVSSDEYCETAPADRKQVTFTILPASLESDIEVNNASICLGTPATLTPTSALPGSVFFWYFDANKTQPILNGTTSGVTYAVNSTTGVLTVTGLTVASSPVSYYVAVTSDNTCQNKAGELKVATVIVNDPPTPTSTNNPQNFCLINAPTVANLQANEANVVWYLAASGGTALDPTTALVNGTIYHGAIKDLLGCESSVRSAITVNIANPATPTSINNPQNFCLANAPTVANLQANEANVVWYLAASGGTSLDPTTALINGTIYYGAIKDGAGCESSVRSQITANVTDPGTPTLVTPGTQNFCLVDAPTFASVQFTVTNIVWYTALTGGTSIASTTALTNGTYYASIKDATSGCESLTRLPVTINVTDPATPTSINNPQNFCLVNAPTVANLQANEANVVWYLAASGGTSLDPTTALINGSIYYGAIKDGAGCESSVRSQITANVTDPGTPTLVTPGTQNFCLVDAPTFASVQFTVTNIVWYTALTGGTSIASTTALTNGTYYASIKDATSGCESLTRLPVTINITDPATPTSINNPQNFCLVNAPTVANLQANEANVVWYLAASGGTSLDPTTALINGTIYYGAIKDGTGCESSVRSQITANVTDPGTPTLVTPGTQNFCLVDALTFASVQFTVTNIVWYTALTGGTSIASTTALTSGTYYASIKDATSGCESLTRLPVTINVTDPATPTSINNPQNFCLVNAPTVANLQANEANVVWYLAASGGTSLDPTTALINGTIYYGAIKDGAGCESSIRSQITANVTDPGTPTLVTPGTQNFCLIDAPTFASVQFTVTNIVWYTALTGGTSIASTTALTSGTYYASIKDATSGCESLTRLPVTINVTDPATPTSINNPQNFCLVNAPTVANLQANEANVVWYLAASGGTSLDPTTALINGTIYYGAIKDGAGCESSIRSQITANVANPATPTSTNNPQNFCLANAPTVANLHANEANVVWYLAASGGTSLDPTTALVNGTIYYGAIRDGAGCESSVRSQITANVTDPGTPTLVTPGTQNFCLVDSPTFASVKFTVTNIVWYTALTGGTSIASTTALTSGTYYASIKDATSGCESLTRLPVTISVTDPAKPTTTLATQVFCSENNPTVANIQVNETNVVWYSAENGGTPIAATTALVSGDYFAALKDASTGCESSIRLKVTVTVGGSNVPTTNNAAQNFCSTTAPTFASIQVNESNVSWFNGAIGGTAIPLTTALTSGIYYGEITNPLTGCKSATRLPVTITIVNPMPTPTTTSSTQNFCSVNAPKVSNIQVNESNVIWYSTATGGTAIPATTALANGTYYGVVASGSGCENPLRLQVIVNVNTPGIVTTPRVNQTFCLSAAPTIESIVVNEANVIWYTSANGGTPLAANTPLTASTYYASVLNNTTNGCEGATRLGVTVSFENDALVPITTTDDTPCVFQGVTYSIANGKSDYIWTIENGTITSGGGNADGTVTISWSDIGPGKVNVTYINTCNEKTTKSLNVNVATCSDLTITNTVSNPTPNFGEQITFTVTVNNVGEGNFINTIVSELLPSGFDLISASTTAGTYDLTTQLWTIPTLNAGQSVVLTIVAEVLSSGNYTNVATVEISTPLDVDTSNNSASVTVVPVCLTVYNEFTPNNDGANDLFRIDCIESYPNNELKVYNRYGSLVYSKQHYENDWDGTANVSGVINRGDMLPTGTYFYVITIGDGTVKKGWLSIMR